MTVLIFPIEPKKSCFQDDLAYLLSDVGQNRPAKPQPFGAEVLFLQDEGRAPEKLIAQIWDESSATLTFHVSLETGKKLVGAFETIQCSAVPLDRLVNSMLSKLSKLDPDKPL